MNYSPRQSRFLRCLSNGEHSRIDLNTKVGALNVPEIKRQLLMKGFKIICKRRPIRDRDGRVTFPGYYSFENDQERQRVKELLASAPTPASDINNHKAKQSTDKRYSTTEI